MMARTRSGSGREIANFTVVSFMTAPVIVFSCFTLMEISLLIWVRTIYCKKNFELYSSTASAVEPPSCYWWISEVSFNIYWQNLEQTIQFSGFCRRSATK